MPESFDLDAMPPTVVLAARHNKNRKPRTQPLPQQLVDILRSYLNGKPPGHRIWGGTWASDHRGAEMVRKDLEDAGIPYIVEGPDGPLFADFHAFRHTFLTLLGRGGVDLRTVQGLAGHSSPVVTARYSHPRLPALAQAVQKLPAMVPGEQVPAMVADEKVCPRLDQPTDSRCLLVSVPGTTMVVRKGNVETTQPLVNQGVGHRQTASVISGHQRGRRDSNPQPPDRQSGTLTN